MTVTHAPAREKVPVTDRIIVSERIAAELCSVSVVTFRKWVAAGAIRRVDVPGDVRLNLYRRADIEAFAAARSAGA